MENNNEKKNLLAELQEVLMNADFEFNQVEAIITIHEALSIEEIKESLKKYKAYKDNYNRTSEIVDTYNTVMKEEMDNFREEAVDVIDSFLIEKAKEKGVEYKPKTNPYRQTNKEDDSK